MKHILLAIVAFMAVASASAQPSHSRDRTRLDPEVRAAMRDYCQIKHRQHKRNNSVAVPAVCYRLFGG